MISMNSNTKKMILILFIIILQIFCIFQSPIQITGNSLDRKYRKITETKAELWEKEGRMTEEEMGKRRKELNKEIEEYNKGVEFYNKKAKFSIFSKEKECMEIEEITEYRCPDFYRG